jgi:hypothetical protein
MTATDHVSRLLAALEARGLPVEGIGLPGRAGSLCPICHAGLGIEFLEAAVSLSCTAGCDEADVAAALKGAS